MVSMSLALMAKVYVIASDGIMNVCKTWCRRIYYRVIERKSALCVFLQSSAMHTA